MAPATIESSGSEHEISAAASILRNDDPLSHALRDGMILDVHQIAHLSRTVPLSESTLSSVESSSTIASSSRRESATTKLVSADTDHLANSHKDKQKHTLRKGYTSSVTVTYGSASEAEVERMALRRGNLIAMGDWADVELEHARPLKGIVRARDRQTSRRRSKQKKPIVFKEQNSHAKLSDRVAGRSEERGLMLMTAPSYGGTDPRPRRHRSPNLGNDPVRGSEEGQPHVGNTQFMVSKPLSRTRLYILAGIAVVKVLTVAAAAYCAYLTGKTRISCTKGIVLAATAFMANSTILAMMIARRALSEALLAGLIEFVFGFAVLVELDDFM